MTCSIVLVATKYKLFCSLCKDQVILRKASFCLFTFPFVNRSYFLLCCLFLFSLESARLIQFSLKAAFSPGCRGSNKVTWKNNANTAWYHKKRESFFRKKLHPSTTLLHVPLYYILCSLVTFNLCNLLPHHASIFNSEMLCNI